MSVATTTTDVPRLEAYPAAMRFLHALGGPVTLRRLRVEVTGRERVPGAGGVLLAANHRSFLDHFVLSAAAPRPPRFLGKIELSEGLHGRFNLAFGLLPVARGTADVEALETVVERLRAGDCVAMFPEGTRSPTGDLYRFRSGLARIAAAAAAPVVPVGLIGMETVWPRGEDPSWQRPPAGRLQVRFGSPVTAADDTPRARRELTEAVWQQVLELCGQPPGSGFAPINPQSGTGSS